MNEFVRIQRFNFESNDRAIIFREENFVQNFANNFQLLFSLLVSINNPNNILRILNAKRTR